jgi:hypothetical protein
VGKIVGDRYLIGTKLDQGAQGKVYEVHDKKFMELKLAIKIVKRSNEFLQEIFVIKELSPSLVLDYGSMDDGSQQYMIMPRLGKTIWQFVVKEKNKLSKFSILALGRLVNTEESPILARERVHLQ